MSAEKRLQMPLVSPRSVNLVGGGLTEGGSTQPFLISNNIFFVSSFSLGFPLENWKQNTQPLKFKKIHFVISC